MNNKKRRIIAVSLITLLAILAGFAVDIIWGTVERKTHPIDYAEYVEKYSAEYNIPTYVIYAVIKVESDFEPDALSVDGAYGLMQMMPDTFDDITGNNGDESGQYHLNEHLDFSALSNPDVSIRYGVYYLNYLYQMFDRNINTAIAAYNGGLGNVRKWLSNPEYSDGKGNLTYIPFPETRNYVAKVNHAMDTYQELYQ